MAFETNCFIERLQIYLYSLHPNVKKYTLRDNTFAVTKLEVQVKSFARSRFQIVAKALPSFSIKRFDRFKISITDKSGASYSCIFKNPENDIIQQNLFS